MLRSRPIGKQTEVYLNMVALHVACGIPKEPVHHESLRIYAVDQGVRRLPTHKHTLQHSGIIFMLYNERLSLSEVKYRAGEIKKSKI